MNLPSTLDRDAYVDFLLKQYRNADAFWFLETEKRFGLVAAEAGNEAVWGQAARLAARDLKKIFSLERGGLDGFLEAIRLFPWTLIAKMNFVRTGDPGGPDDEIRLEMAECPPHVARERRKLPPYACKAMHLAEFSAFAREIDPRIRVECLHAPPDPVRDGRICRWRFSLES